MEIEKTLIQVNMDSVEWQWNQWLGSLTFAGAVMIFVNLTQFMIICAFQVLGFFVSCAVWYFDNIIQQFSLLLIAALIIYCEKTITDFLVPEAWAWSGMVYKIRVFENQSKRLTWTLAIVALLRIIGYLLRMLHKVVLFCEGVFPLFSIPLIIVLILHQSPVFTRNDTAQMVKGFVHLITTKTQTLMKHFGRTQHAILVRPGQQDDNYCCICMAQSRDVAFVPCGHVSTCTDCAAALHATDGELRCPICRSLTSRTLKIFF